jgi:hypothetical protein
MKKITYTLLILITTLVILFRLFFGIFVIQPIGAIPDGVTIIYLRTGLNLPFISSADGLLEESGLGVSILGRAVMLSKLAEPISDKTWFRFDYSEKLYLWSTNGKKYDI